MSLTNEDLKKIRGVVKEEVDQSIADKVRPIIKEEIGEAIETKVRPIVQEEVDKGVEFLASITKKEFDIVHGEFDIVHKEISDIKIDVTDIKIDIAGVKTDIADHDFKMTELVPKVQHFYLEQRVRRLEEKAGIRHEK